MKIQGIEEDTFVSRYKDIINKYTNNPIAVGDLYTLIDMLVIAKKKNKKLKKKNKELQIQVEVMKKEIKQLLVLNQTLRDFKIQKNIDLVSDRSCKME